MTSVTLLAHHPVSLLLASNSAEALALILNNLTRGKNTPSPNSVTQHDQAAAIPESALGIGS